MGRKRAQSPSRAAAASGAEEAEASTSQQPAEPVKEPTAPLQVFYCAGKS